MDDDTSEREMAQLAAKLFNEFSRRHADAKDCLVFFRRDEEMQVIAIHNANNEEEAQTYYSYDELRQMILTFLSPGPVSEQAPNQEENGFMQ